MTLRRLDHSPITGFVLLMVIVIGSLALTLHIGRQLQPSHPMPTATAPTPATAAAQRAFAAKLALLKDEAYRVGLPRTARLIEIPLQEIGWEMAGDDTPAYQKARQQETLTP